MQILKKIEKDKNIDRKEKKCIERKNRKIWIENKEKRYKKNEKQRESSDKQYSAQLKFCRKTLNIYCLYNSNINIKLKEIIKQRIWKWK